MLKSHSFEQYLHLTVVHQTCYYCTVYAVKTEENFAYLYKDFQGSSPLLRS